jgi:hypothetical protein
MNYKGLVVFPSPPMGSSNSMPASPVSPVSRGQSPIKSRFTSLPFGHMANDGHESPVSAQSEDENDFPAPLNVAMGKRQDKKKLARSSAPTSSPKPATPLKPGEDTFDRHVSEVLDRLPSNAIRFKAKPAAVTPTSRTAEPRNYSGPRPKASTRVPSRASLGGLTLAPAEASPRKQATDEVKVYHLSQAGRDEPIKLFVRLVGEGERVMVRVGGGWADLADYLRQYAEHHGSRTVSGSGLELQTAESAGPGSRKVSSSATPVDAKAEGPPITPVAAGPRPGSMLGNLLPGLGNPEADDQPRFSMGDSSPTDGSSDSAMAAPQNQAQTPNPTVSSRRSTPKSTSTKDNSRPSTAGSVGRPGSRQGWIEGLGGKGKRSDLPDQKARWVEGMIEKAKAASAEKSKEEKAKSFGEIGKAGGTRRVIFRKSSATNGGAESK